MATDTSDPIVIGSDDESDSDDVVLIKEEIEVDSEDVIFLSETRATPRSDVETTLSKKVELTPSESKTSLSSNISLTTGTGQLTLDDSDDADILDSILVNSATSAVGPLDLSSKSADSNEKGSDSANPVHTDSNLQNAVDGSNTDSSFMMLLTGAEPILQSSDGHGLELKSEKSAGSTLQPVIQGGVSGTDSVVGGTCSLGDENSHSNDQTNLQLRLGTPSCDNSLSNNISASDSSDADWSAFKLSPSKQTTSTNQQTDKNSSDPSVGVAGVGCIVNTCKDVDNSVIVNTGHPLLASSNQTGQQKVAEAGNQSVISSQLVTAGQALKNTSSSDSDTKTIHVIANNPRSVTADAKGASVDLSDPFQASHALLASLDMTLNSDSQTGSINQTDPSSPNTGTQSICPTTGAVNFGQTANFTNGLLGGSIQCIQPTVSQSLGASINNDTSSSLSIFKRSLSMMDTSTPYYNSLTLPLSQQNKTYRRSVSSGSFVSYKNALSGSSTDLSPQSPRSPSPQNPHHLPPKKQKRYYSDATQDFNCANCELNLTGQRSSRCPNGHATCTKCLEERVKLVLTGRAKESVKCLNKSCDSYYPISELRHSLPAMVVEILEDKLDQDYVDYITDMIMKKASEEIDQESASADPEQAEDGRFLKKYEDCPGNWDPMDERNVNRDGYVLVPLETESADYQHVVLRFFDSMVDHSVEVTSVYRVQNPIQWKYYMVKKSEMLRESGGFYSVVEDQLFHGTSSSSVEAICRKGFDWRLCGKHGTLYGQGSYFAVNASYSHQYTDLRRPHGTLRSSFTSSPSMTLPTAPSLMFPPMNVNFGQPLHPVTSPVGISVIQTTQYRPMNLSHNAAASQQVGVQNVCIKTGQPTQSGSQNLNNSSQSSSSQFGSSATGSLTNTAQPGPSGSSGTSNSASFMQSIRGLRSSDISIQKRLALHARRKHGRLCSRRILPKPLAVRNLPGLTSTGLGTNFDVQQEVEKQKAKVFFARVLVGKYTVGSPKLRKPPPLYPNSDQYGKCYDSCVDNEADPKIFVIFDSTQAYPEYLVEYTYSGDKLF